MSYLVAAPEMVQAAAADLQCIGAALIEANSAAAIPPRMCWPPVATRCLRRSLHCLPDTLRPIKD